MLRHHTKSSNENEYDLNLEDSDNNKITTSTQNTPIWQIIWTSITLVLHQQLIATHQVNPPIVQQNRYKLTWNGANLIQPAREEEPKTPFKAWLKMKKYAQANVLFADGMEFNKSNSKKSKKKKISNSVIKFFFGWLIFSKVFWVNRLQLPMKNWNVNKQ